MTEHEYMKKLGNNIRFFRTRKKMTQTDLAQEIGKSLASVSKYERGDCAIDTYTLCVIAEALGVSVPQLLPIEHPGAPKDRYSMRLTGLREYRIFYLYYVGYISQKIGCSVLEVNWDTGDTVMYISCEDPREYNRCERVMRGKAWFSDACTGIFVTEPDTPTDFFHILINGADWYAGKHTCRISYSTMNWRAVTSRAMITTTPGCPDTFAKDIEITRQEIKELRQQNQLML